jgi:hypothetical protein
MSNKKNSLNRDHVIGNYIFHWEEKTRDGHSYLRIKTAYGSWQLRLRDDQECTMMWHNLLEEGTLDEALKSWVESMEMVNTAIGDEIFSLQVAFASQTFMLRHAVYGNDEATKKMQSITDDVIDKIKEWWKSYLDAFPKSDISKYEDDRILEDERKLRIDNDMDKQKIKEMK